MSIINFHDPTVINMNLDDNGQPVSLPIQNETKQVVDGKIPLEGLPDEQYRIQITGYVEIDIRDKIDSPEKFKCDYTHGVLYFDQSLNGASINIDKYYSRGQFFIPSSRVWTKLSDTGEVQETLKDFESQVQGAVDITNDINGTIDMANTTKQNLDNSITVGENTIRDLDNLVGQTDFATINDKIGDLSKLTTTEKTNLSGAVSEVKNEVGSLKEDYMQHLNSNMPHKMKLDGKDYKYGLTQEDGFVKFIYEEVV